MVKKGSSTTPELMVAVINWAISQGAANIRGIWSGETDQWEVKINGSFTEIEDMAPFSVHLTHKDSFAIAVLDPTGGVRMGIDEDAAIAHFRDLAGKDRPNAR